MRGVIHAARLKLLVPVFVALVTGGAVALGGGTPGSAVLANADTPAPVAPSPVVSVSSCFSQAGHTDGVDATNTPSGWIPLVGTTQATMPWNMTNYSAQCRAAFVIAYLPVADESLPATITPTAQETTAFGPGAQAYADYATALANDYPTEPAGTVSGGWPASLMLVTTSSGSGSDGPNGVNGQYAFPDQNLLGNSWDPAQAYQEGVAMGTVAHDTNATGVNTPEMSIERTWHQGRAPEGLGEDPELASQIAVQEMHGIQSMHETTEVKHCCGYTQEAGRVGDAISNWGPLTGANAAQGSQASYNYSENETVSERALQEIYLPGFEATVRPTSGGGGGATAVMCSYATVNGATTPSMVANAAGSASSDPSDPGQNPYLDEGHESCDNHYLMQDVLKNQFGFLGTVVNDCCTLPRTDLLAYLAGDDSPSYTKDSLPDDLNNNPIQNSDPLSYTGMQTDAASEAILQQPISGTPLTVTAAFQEALIPETKLVDTLTRKLVPGWLVGVDQFPHNNNGYDETAITATARATADDGSVLLQNTDHLLPLDPTKSQNLVVIGQQAYQATDPVTGEPVGTSCSAGGYPSAVPNSGCDVQFVNTGSGDADIKAKDNPVDPLTGIQAEADSTGDNVDVTFQQGTQGISPQPLLQEQVDGSGDPLATNELSTDKAGLDPGVTATYYNDDDFGADTPSNDNPILATRTEKSIMINGVPSDVTVGSDPGDFAASVRADNQWSVKWQGYFTPQNTGEYHFYMFASGSSKFWIGPAGSNLANVTTGNPAASVLHADFGFSDQSYQNLVAGQTYPIEVDYAPADAAGSNGLTVTGNNVPASEPGGVAGTVTAQHNTSQGGGLGNGVILGVSEPNQMLQNAVNAAAGASEAVIFAGEQAGEGMDRTSLSLPGNQNELIEDVAAVQPNTIVVLDGPGAYTMPWLDQVKSVIDMFYPGTTFGTSAADLLFGNVDPSGHLSETFPANQSQGPGGTSKSDYPGLTSHQHAATGDATDPTNMYDDFHPLAQETYSEGIDVGYRYWLEHDQTPLFPFGYGLSYTTFTQKIVAEHTDNAGNILLDVQVTNTGSVEGKDVVEGYVEDPSSTGEPPMQLKAYTKVDVPAGQSVTTTIGFPPRAFAFWNDAGTSQYSQGDWHVEAGNYTIAIAKDAEESDIVDSVNVTLPEMDLDPTSYANDVAAPVASASLSPSASNGVYTSHPTVTLSADSPAFGSTVGSIQYNLDGTGWVTYGAPFQITGNGSHQLQYRVVDNYGTTGGNDSQAITIAVPASGTTSTMTTPSTTTTVTPPLPKLVATLTVPKQTLKSIEKAKALNVRCRANTAATCRVVLTISATMAKRLGLAGRKQAKAYTLASETGKLNGDGSVTIKVKLSSKVLLGLRRLRGSLKISAGATVTASGGRRANKTASLTVRS
jgi:beta-glucosidase